MDTEVILGDLLSNPDLNGTSENRLERYSVISGEKVTTSMQNTTSYVTRNEYNNSGNSPVQLSIDLRISLYSIIFVLSVIGNSLVILTLVQNRRMRTVTNVFLLNLAISDMLLAVFCMPFTLIPTLLQNFIFGHVMCIMIRYVQGVSVAVSVFTLVFMSLERYFAICQPLRSRTWQTLSHSYRMIAVVWAFSFIIMIPIAVYQKLIPIGHKSHKCLEIWNNQTWEKTYTLFLDLVLLVGPLVLMLLAYSKISWTLWKGIKFEISSTQGKELQGMNTCTDENTSDDQHINERTCNLNSNLVKPNASPVRQFKSKTNNRVRTKHRNNPKHKIRQSNTTRSLAAKKRIIRMLFVLVLEFFVCWTPMYVLQTWYVFDLKSATARISPVTMNFIHLLTYVSSCCNPITYCFMNEKFRQGFLDIFRCCRRTSSRLDRRPSENTFYSQRTGTNIRKHGDHKKLISMFRLDPAYHICAVTAYNRELCYPGESLV